MKPANLLTSRESMPPEAILVTAETSGATEDNLLKLINFMGIECQVIPVDGVSSLLQRKGNSSKLCLMGSGKSMLNVLKSYENSEDSKSSLFGTAHSILLYELDDSGISSQVLMSFLGDTFVSIDKFKSNDYKFIIGSNQRNICGHLSGLTIEPINKETDYGIAVAGNTENVSKLISIGSKGFFIKSKRYDCDIFCIACKEVSNIDDKLLISSGERIPDIRRYFSRLMPILMYLKYTFKEGCWHVNNCYANVIIDDPLLKPDYGYLNYGKLLNVMDERKFSTTMAFIPWNYRRSNSSVVRMFLNRNERYSIAIHGCDHNRNEFGVNDIKELNRKSKVAKKRMEVHTQKTGLECPSVMIFPQGKFSKEALRILKFNEYSSAVNSEIIPSPKENNGNEIELSQILSLAITKYSSFPVFARRYPSEGIQNFSFDLFMGKPCLIVLHHDYFKKGYGELADLIGQLNALGENLQWKGLGHILRNIYLCKTNSSGTIEVKMYSNNVILQNSSNERRSYVIYKEESDFERIKKVTINGDEASFINEVNNMMRMECNIEAGGKADIAILYDDPYKHLKLEERTGKRIRTLGRRCLVEVRDNFISKNDMVMGLVARIGRMLH